MEHGKYSWQRAEDRRQTTEDRSQRSEVGGSQKLIADSSKVKGKSNSDVGDQRTTDKRLSSSVKLITNNE